MMRLTKQGFWVELILDRLLCLHGAAAATFRAEVKGGETNPLCISLLDDAHWAEKKYWPCIITMPSCMLGAQDQEA